MALSKIVENSLADSAVSSAKLKDFAAAVDLNGVELVLDADADTSITADTDDRIDFKIAGVEHFSFSNSSGDTIIKPMVDAKDIKFQQFDGRTLLDINDGGFVGIANGATGAGAIRIFEDTDNGSNYVGLTAGSISSSFTLTLPTADGSNGHFLKTDGSGTLSFASATYDGAITTLDIDGGTDIGAGLADADLFIVDDGAGGTNRKTAASRIKTYIADVTLTTAAQTNITSLGTLTALTVDDVAVNGKVVTMTGSTDDTAVFTVATNGALTIETTDTAAAAANIQITADGTFEVDGSTITLDSAGDIILDAAGNDFNFKAGGTEVLRITNSSSDVIIRPVVDAKDLIFQQRDGTEVARVEDNGTFNIVTDKLAINGTAVTSTAAELNKLDGAGTIKQAGKETIWIPSTAMVPTNSNGCSALTKVETTSGRPDMNVLDFDKDSDEFAQFAVAFPKSWNEGTVTFQFYWSGIAATTGVAMNLQGVAFADNDSIDTAYGTAVVVQDDAQGAVEELLVSAESGAITIAGSPSTDELVYFRLGRDVSDGNDDMAGDCRIHGVKLFFTTDAANDA